MSKEQAARPRRQPDTLLQLIPPGGSTPLPDGFARGEALFGQAAWDYKAGRFGNAALRVVDAARALEAGLAGLRS